LDEYLEKYGTRTLFLTIAHLIELSPEFEGDEELAGELGRQTADLAFALEDYQRRCV